MKTNHPDLPTAPSPVDPWRRVIIAGVMGAIAICAWQWSDVREAPTAAARDEPPVLQARRDLSVAPLTPASSTTPAQPAQIPDSAANASLIDYSSKKYAFLLSNLFQQSAPIDELREALLKREQLAVELNTSRQASDPAVREKIPEQEQTLARADDQLRALLHPADYAVFDVLKDSDIEQFQLNDYADGIANVAPLTAEDRRAILLTKLNYKRYFRQVLVDSGILRDDLSAADREYAFTSVSRALEEYKNSYLQEVRQYLVNEEQYALLSNYETTEFTAELAKLRSMSGG